MKREWKKRKEKQAKSMYLTVKTWAYVKLLFSYDRRLNKNVVELGHCSLQTFFEEKRKCKLGHGLSVD
jgi:hypothetical protein